MNALRHRIAAEKPPVMRLLRQTRFFSAEEIHVAEELINIHWLENKAQEEHGRFVMIETSSQEKYQATRTFYLKTRDQEYARIADFHHPGDDRMIYVKYLGQNGSMKPNG
ncbi:MAG: hypothetical protein BWY83_02962 [bacterium ADurb.Bin478]|nr:MAG: hypothetical protein BWY83_02962 [bacterium ADurb.Bin478]